MLLLGKLLVKVRVVTPKVTLRLFVIVLDATTDVFEGFTPREVD